MRTRPEARYPREDRVGFRGPLAHFLRVSPFLSNLLRRVPNRWLRRPPSPFGMFRVTSRVITATLSLLLLHGLISVARAATIVSVSPQRGGLQGGTQVTISGSGFSRDGIQVRGLAVRLYHGHAVEYALVCRAQRLCTSATTFARRSSTSPTIRRSFACRRRTPSARACVSRKS